MLKIKDWAKFQHFKDRKPPWIKLYRDILDDIQWHELCGEDAKLLVMLWLIASENEGELPPLKEVAFRLRITEKSLKTTVSKLSHWLRQDDITPITDNATISPDHQDDIAAIPLTRSQETETETERRFEEFWKKYPKHVSRKTAKEAFGKQKINEEFQSILDDIELKCHSSQWQKNGGEFIPHPATYLNQRRWEDDAVAETGMGNFL
jgi:hypothetical protein